MRLPLWPRRLRGQMIALAGAPVSINRTLHSSRCYLVPRKDGRVLVGATVEYVGFRKANTAGGINSLLAAAIEVAPSLRACEIVETWSGLRPDTSDHLPLIGPSGIDNLLLATGHFRNGILLAPVTAELIALAGQYGAPDLRALAEQVRQRNEHKRWLLHRMIEYAQTDECRRRFILDYFGDRGDADANQLSGSNRGRVFRARFDPGHREVELVEQQLPMLAEYDGIEFFLRILEPSEVVREPDDSRRIGVGPVDFLVEPDEGHG